MIFEYAVDSLDSSERGRLLVNLLQLKLLTYELNAGSLLNHWALLVVKICLYTINYKIM
jgi:hypothetical protein